MKSAYSPYARIHSSREDIVPPLGTSTVPELHGTIGRNKWWIVLLSLAGAAAFAYLGSHVPPQYTADGLLLVEPKAKTVLGFESVTSSLSSELVGLDTQIGLLTAPPALEAAAGRLGHQIAPNGGDLRKAIVHGLAVRGEGKGNLIRISFSSPSPEFSANVVNAVAEQFIAAQIERKQDEIREVKDSLRTRVNELYRQVQLADQAVAAYRQDHPDVSGSDQFYLGQMAQFTYSLMEAEAELQVKDAQIRRAHGAGRAEENGGGRALSMPTIGIGPVNVPPESAQGRDPRRARAAFLTAALDEVRLAYSRYQSAQFGLQPLIQQADSARQFYDEMRGRLQEIEEDERFVDADTEIVSRAVPPAVSSTPGWELLAVLGLIISGFFGVLLALLVEQVRRRNAAPI